MNLEEWTKTIAAMLDGEVPAWIRWGADAPSTSEHQLKVMTTEGLVKKLQEKGATSKTIANYQADIKDEWKEIAPFFGQKVED